MRILSEGNTGGGVAECCARTSPRRRCGIGAVLAAFGVVVVFAAGCASSSTKAATAGASTQAAASGASTITVQMTEYKFALSRMNLSAGTYTFDAVNSGKIDHALAITGPGLSSPASTKTVQPGKSADLTVALQAGTYDVYCPVGNHKQLGMNLDLTVATSAATPAPATAPTTVPSSGSVSY
jgi:uncharacterized cupredoxin-like copper-binding protein